MPSGVRISRRALLSTVAAIGLLGLEPAVFRSLTAAKADTDASYDDEGASQSALDPGSSYSESQYSGLTFEDQSRSQFWISSLDLLSRDPLLDTTRQDQQDQYGVGHPLLMRNGEPIPDVYSRTGIMISPTTDVSPVVAAGQLLGRCLALEQELTPSRSIIVQAQGFIWTTETLFIGLGSTLGWGGLFDYQRTGAPGFFQQYPQYRDVSNFNIGVLAQQAGLSEAYIQRIAGLAAAIGSSNSSFSLSRPETWQSRAQDWNSLQNQQLIHLGYGLSEQGVLSAPHVP